MKRSVRGGTRRRQRRKWSGKCNLVVTKWFSRIPCQSLRRGVLLCHLWIVGWNVSGDGRKVTELSCQKGEHEEEWKEMCIHISPFKTGVRPAFKFCMMRFSPRAQKLSSLCKRSCPHRKERSGRPALHAFGRPASQPARPAGQAPPAMSARGGKREFG